MTIPDAAFLPGSRRIAASAIWWSHSPEAYHVHCDTNALGAVFVLTAVTVPGCELAIDKPCDRSSLPNSICLKAKSSVVGGGQYAHCNAPVLDSTSPRRSWVVYLDHRAICSSYRSMVPPKQNSTNESLTTEVLPIQPLTPTTELLPVWLQKRTRQPTTVVNSLMFAQSLNSSSTATLDRQSININWSALFALGLGL
jgi:hypothetical protein